MGYCCRAGEIIYQDREGAWARLRTLGSPEMPARSPPQIDADTLHPHPPRKKDWAGTSHLSSCPLSSLPYQPGGPGNPHGRTIWPLSPGPYRRTPPQYRQSTRKMQRSARVTRTWDVCRTSTTIASMNCTIRTDVWGWEGGQNMVNPLTQPPQAPTDRAQFLFLPLSTAGAVVSPSAARTDVCPEIKLAGGSSLH